MARLLVELRVHGVSGTPPEEMLDIDRVRQVAGDELGRVFERADRIGGPLREPDDHRTLAYHWGRLTSGSMVQGLWVLLAPFGLVNAAQFALEPPESTAQRAAHAVAGAMLRLLGLMLTALFVLAAAVITIDLWAWQRAGATNGLAIVLGMFGPVVLLGVYLLLARSRAAATMVVAADKSTMPVAPEGQRHSDLVRPGFFEGDPAARALRRLHVAAGLTLVAVVGFSPGAVREDPLGLAGFRVALVLLVLIGAFVVVLGDPERSASTDWRPPGPLRASFSRLSNPIAVWVVGLSVLVLAVAMVHVGANPLPVSPREQHFAGIDWASFVVMLVAVAALVVLAVANGVLAFLRRHSDARGRRSFGPYAKGMACTLIAAVGMFLGVGYTGAFTTFLATAMTTEARTVAVPELLARVVYAWGITVVGILALAVVALLGLHRDRPTLAGYARRDFTPPDPTTGWAGPLRVPERWITTIATAMWVARLKNRVAGVMTFFVLLGVLLALVVMYELAPLLSVAVGTWPRLNAYPREAGWLGILSASPTWPSDLIGNLAVVRSAVIAIGTAALTGLATALVFLGRKALRGETGRRGINVLWDVISFWPRSAHPFVPAAYSQRAVPDLEHLIRAQLADDPHAALVLCGHSQGSLLSFAALLRLQATDPELLQRIGLLTFGSQLQVMFSRGFPAYVNHDAIDHLYTDLDGRWRNLYRDTDHLAGPVLSWSHDRLKGAAVRVDAEGRRPSTRKVGREENGPDWRLADPPIPARADLDRAVLLPMRRHSSYWLDQAWTAAVNDVRAPVRVDVPEPAALQRVSVAGGFGS
ncbi:hypothetical protein [Pseudonocardia sp.]|jgi:hypothetical protein|uniref:hypothetical protein n=1 Tax=Pseudonocardia sp. TaxID=60912 RepID=UPI0031FC34BB